LETTIIGVLRQRRANSLYRSSDFGLLRPEAAKAGVADDEEVVPEVAPQALPRGEDAT